MLRISLRVCFPVPRTAPTCLPQSDPSMMGRRSSLPTGAETHGRDLSNLKRPSVIVTSSLNSFPALVPENYLYLQQGVLD